MKKIIFTILILLCLSIISNAQWITQYPYTPAVGLRDIEFINLNTGWICGDGIIMKTTNRGQNWIIQDNPTPSKYLYSIHPVDSNVVYCVGWFETLLKSTNGGNNWFALLNGIIGQSFSYEALFFINANTGWFAGTGNYIHKTTNGGISFDSVYLLGSHKDFHFKDFNTGLLVGGGGDIFKTSNSGNNWYRISLPPNIYGNFRKISVINNQYCFLVEDARKVFKSTNYGDTWDSVGYVTGADEPYSCRFSSLQTGWVCGTYGEIFKSTNGGATWNIQYVNTTNIGWLRSFWFQNDYTGWAIGGNTKLLFTSTGGATFIENHTNEITEEYILFQNYPNPFNNKSKIKFDIPQQLSFPNALIGNLFVSLKVYEITGREVATFVNESLKPGTYEVIFNGGNLSSGIYFYSLIINGTRIDTKKMIIVK